MLHPMTPSEWWLTLLALCIMVTVAVVALPQVWP